MSTNYEASLPSGFNGFYDDGLDDLVPGSRESVEMYLGVREKVSGIINKLGESAQSKNSDIPFNGGGFYKGMEAILNGSEQSQQSENSFMDTFGKFFKKESKKSETMENVKKALMGVSNTLKEFQEEIKKSDKDGYDVLPEDIAREYTKKVKQGAARFILASSEAGLSGSSLMAAYGALIVSTGCDLKENSLNINDFTNTKNNPIRDKIKEIVNGSVVGYKSFTEESLKEGYGNEEAAFDSANAMDPGSKGMNSKTYEMGVEFEAGFYEGKIKDKLNSAIKGNSNKSQKTSRKISGPH